MNSAPDRKKLRREYLWKRGKGRVNIAVRCLVLLVILSSFFAIPMAFAWFGRLHAPLGMFLAIGLPAFCGVIWLGATWLDTIQEQGRELQKIPYVPPVTADTLPADEILVRGSNESPAIQSEVLLRAANGQDTPKAELLRVSAEEYE